MDRMGFDVRMEKLSGFKRNGAIKGLAVIRQQMALGTEAFWTGVDSEVESVNLTFKPVEPEAEPVVERVYVWLPAAAAMVVFSMVLLSLFS